MSTNYEASHFFRNFQLFYHAGKALDVKTVQPPAQSGFFAYFVFIIHGRTTSTSFAHKRYYGQVSELLKGCQIDWALCSYSAQ
jgi:hypothetical protein